MGVVIGVSCVVFFVLVFIVRGLFGFRGKVERWRNRILEGFLVGLRILVRVGRLVL